jgi:hypothetical protein
MKKIIKSLAAIVAALLLAAVVIELACAPKAQAQYSSSWGVVARVLQLTNAVNLGAGSVLVVPPGTMTNLALNPFSTYMDRGFGLGASYVGTNAAFAGSSLIWLVQYSADGTNWTATNAGCGSGLWITPTMGLTNITVATNLSKAYMDNFPYARVYSVSNAAGAGGSAYISNVFTTVFP